MPNHYSTIGFSVSSDDQFDELLKQLWPKIQFINCERGQYGYWSAERGAELWLQIVAGRVVRVNPHYFGPTRMNAALIERVERPEYSPMEGAFRAWADPIDNNPESGAYPFIFACPDYAHYTELTLPNIRQVQIAAFAHSVTIYESPDEYVAQESAQREDKPIFASKSFVPSGMFGGASIAQAMIAGHVVEAEVLTNSFSGSEFHWAKVETLGGEIDVVIGMELVQMPLLVGGVIRGTFWLSGRLLDAS